MNSNTKALALATLLALTAACNIPGSARNSAIVRQVEAAGAGNLDRHPHLIAPFLDEHLDLARQLKSQCDVASVHGGAVWRNTTEGMICVQAELIVEHGAGYRDPEVERTVQQAEE